MRADGARPTEPWASFERTASACIKFDDLTEVEAVIDRLPELIVKLSRRARRERGSYAHLLSGTPVVPEADEVAPQTRSRPDLVATGRGQDRIAALESEVAQLRDEIENLKQQFAGFKRQFE